MTKAILYDSLYGMVYRCMFAGIDEYGHAQWVNITPGEEPKTLDDYVAEDGLREARFFLLAMEGETAQTAEVARMLGFVAGCPLGNLGADLAAALKQLREMGVKWDHTPLNVSVRVFEHDAKSQRSGKYSFTIEDDDDSGRFLADVDGFDALDELFYTIRTYFLQLDMTAGISCLTKDLRIDEKLRKEVKKSYLGMFGHVEELKN